MIRYLLCLIQYNWYTQRYEEMFLNSPFAWLQQMSRKCSSIVWPVVRTGSARERGSFRVCLISTTCLPVTSVSLPRSSVERQRGWRRVWSTLTQSDSLMWLWNCLSSATAERGAKVDSRKKFIRFHVCGFEELWLPSHKIQSHAKML